VMPVVTRRAGGGAGACTRVTTSTSHTSPHHTSLRTTSALFARSCARSLSHTSRSASCKRDVKARRKARVGNVHTPSLSLWAASVWRWRPVAAQQRRERHSACVRAVRQCSCVHTQPTCFVRSIPRSSLPVGLVATLSTPITTPSSSRLCACACMRMCESTQHRNHTPQRSRTAR
jgi:hypothetical protein